MCHSHLVLAALLLVFPLRHSHSCLIHTNPKIFVKNFYRIWSQKFLRFSAVVFCDSSWGWCFIWDKKGSWADCGEPLPLYFSGSYSLRWRSKGWSLSRLQGQEASCKVTKSQHRTFCLKLAAIYLKLFVWVVVLRNWDKASLIMEIPLLLWQTQ